jgi:hypothetical protein
VIRNAVIHIANEQPLLADLYEMPTAADVSLVCTNVRMLDGKKPIFVDRSASRFVFPYHALRFIEIVPGSGEGSPADADATVIQAAAPEATEPPVDDADIELDEDFLRRIREV